MANTIKKIYQSRKTRCETALAKAGKTDNTLVFCRSLLGLAVIGLFIYGYLEKLPFLYLYLLLPAVLFLVLVNRHRRVKNHMAYLQNLIHINERALLRLSGEWTSFQPAGEQFADAEHPYTGDLNIFGQGSLFQYLNAASLVTGRQALASLLSEKTYCEDIRARQDALRDLAPRLDWRQHVQAIGMGSPYQQEELDQLGAWAGEKPLFLHKNRIYLLWLLPVATVILIILMIHRMVPAYVPLIPLILQTLLVIAGQAVVSGAFKNSERAAAELERYALLLKSIEGEKFQSPLLVDLQGALLPQNRRASQQVKALTGIAALIHMRHSVLYHFVNALTLCDLYIIRKLDLWKSRNGPALKQWFQVIGRFEALSSLAALAHDQPRWAYPEVTGDGPHLWVTAMGHPLISEETRVCNDVSLPRPGSIHIITGSNMSGKSTLLRTVGINLVLAYAGAPVCAGAMNCSLMTIYTSMRVQDSLEQNISTFYAELKRVKLVIDAAHRGEPLIFLLDELLKGTNSRDRIAGAQRIIKNLARQPAIGLVTTHDLELGALAGECPGQIENYHFTDTIINDKLNFDYRLKEGVSRTTNAMALMRLVGITDEE